VRTTDLVGPGLSYRQVEHWIGCGYVPGVETHGSGIPLDITDEQADWIATMARLVAAGFRPERASNVLATSTTTATGYRLTNLGGGIIITFTYGRTT